MAGRVKKRGLHRDERRRREEIRNAPRKRSDLEQRNTAIERFLENRGPTTHGLSEREQKRAHGKNHRHGGVRVYR